MVDLPGLLFIRRKEDTGRLYFVINQDEQFTHAPDTPPVDGWIPLATPARSVAILDPMTGQAGVAAVRKGPGDQTEVYIQLEPGESLVLRTLAGRRIEQPLWPYYSEAGDSTTVQGTWKIEFLEGGPNLPEPFETDRLESWTQRDDDEAKRFAGTARYSIAFDAPAGRADAWRLDLGRVAESARVRVNGHDLGTLFSQPFHRVLPAGVLQPAGNRLAIDVANLSANRIRDLDRRDVRWRIFRDINFVNIDYRPFDASNWPVLDSGLLGPVRLTPLKTILPTP
jgi:hypothetical protein